MVWLDKEWIRPVCILIYSDNQERLADIQHTATIQDYFPVTRNHKIDEEITQY